MSVRKTLIAAFAVLLAGIGGFWWYAGIHGASASGIDITDARLVQTGSDVYAANCAACHGSVLEGQTPNWRARFPDGSFPAPPHDETGHTWHHPDWQLFEVTKNGRPELEGREQMSRMPAFGDKLSDDDIWAVLSYIKSRWPKQVQRRHDMINERVPKR